MTILLEASPGGQPAGWEEWCARLAKLNDMRVDLSRGTGSAHICIHTRNGGPWAGTFQKLYFRHIIYIDIDIYMYIYICLYIRLYIYMSIYMSIYMYRERERVHLKKYINRRNVYISIYIQLYTRTCKIYI